MKRVDIDPKSKLLIVKFRFLKRDWEEAVQTRKNMLTLSRKTYMPALKKYLVPPTPENIEALWEWGFSFPDNWKELVGAEDQIQDTPEVLPYLDIQVPDYLDFLRPYQVTAVQFLKWRKGSGLISDDMGIGKTIEALAWIRWNRNLGPAIIVVPTSTKLQWEREYKKFYGKNVEILYGKTPYPLRKNTSYIINWEILTYWEKTLLKKPFFCMIADEAHYMGNIKSKRTISAMKIAKKCPSFVPMSGTPIETKTRQLFPILKLLDRHLFYSEWEFLNRYCLGKSKDGFPNYDGASHTKELHSKVKKLMIRRKKREVLKDLPPLQRTIVPMDLSKQQRKYKQMEDHFFNTYSPQQRGSIKMEQEFDSLRLQVFDMKYQAIIEWIDEFLLSGEKLVVGVWHQRVIQTLHQHYKECSTMIYGKITGTKREKALQDFYTDKQIIFLQEKSGGVGLDGLQHVCCNMAIIEFPASPTLLDQFESRLERSGQENPMNMAYLIGAGTIEEDIMEALDIRRLNIDAVMDGKESEDVDLLTILFERRMNNE